MLPIRAPPGTLLDDNAFNRSEIRQLNDRMPGLQRLQVIHTVTKLQLAENVFFPLARQYIGAVFNDARGINNNDAAVIELRRHGVANDTQRKWLASATILLHTSTPSHVS